MLTMSSPLTEFWDLIDTCYNHITNKYDFYLCEYEISHQDEKSVAALLNYDKIENTLDPNSTEKAIAVNFEWRDRVHRFDGRKLMATVYICKSKCIAKVDYKYYGRGGDIEDKDVLFNRSIHNEHHFIINFVNEKLSKFLN